MAPAIRGDYFIVGTDVIGDLIDLGQPFLGNRAVLAFDILLADQFFAIAEAAMRRAGGDCIEQSHFVLVQHSFDRCEVHLVARVFGTSQVERFVRIGLDEPLQRLAGFGHFKEMPGHFNRHARFHIAFRTTELQQYRDFIGRIKILDVLRGFVLEERFQTIGDLTVVLGILDRVQECLFPFRRNVSACICHFTPSFHHVLHRALM